MGAEDGSKTDHQESNRLTRREALSRLGIGVGVAYSAPIVLPLNQAGALAGGHEAPGPHGGGGPPWGRPTRPGPPSRPSKPSVPSKP